MLILAFCLSLPFLLTSTTILAYTLTDSILLNCGSQSSSTSGDGRIWDGDAHSKFTPANVDGISKALKAPEQSFSVDQVPFMTARIFQSSFIYTFPVSPGPKFIRLYFYPATYANFSKFDSFFSVTAGDYTLLHNFSSFLAVTGMVEPKPPSFSVKEFVVNVRDDQLLQIKFMPSPRSYAFINGIEIVSMPSNLYLGGDNDPASLVGFKDTFSVDSNTALETLYRLNVGGNDVSGPYDTGMFRKWVQDDPYIFGANNGLASGVTGFDVQINYTNATPHYTAPNTVYGTCRTMGRDGNMNLQYNLTWLFTVDSGFKYLIRLHFCEIQSDTVTRELQRQFDVYLNNQTADQAIDIIGISGGVGVPVFRDYVLGVLPTEGRQKKQDLSLELHPNIDHNPEFADALLNGLEIFKLNQSDGNLAGPNPDPVGPPDASLAKDHGNDKKRWLWLIIGVLAAFVLVLIPVSFICYMRLRKRNSSENMQNSYQTNSLMLELSTDLSAIEEFSNAQLTKLSGKKDYDLPLFSLQSIEIATCYFSDANKIGRGGFGPVYKGKFDGGQEIAVKRLSRNSGQGLEEFKNEVILISKLQHRNLVRLLGCCIGREERILIYEYMPNGSLDSFLFDAAKRPLIDWQLRFHIIEGIAQGLLYLHKYSRLRIIHRDLKTSNILLDIQMNPKISDFGTARIFKENESQANTRRIVGTHGYMSPEYAMDGLFSIKSDVFSFGVMILEIISGKRNTIAFHRTDCSLNLIGYAWELWKEGRGLELMDPSLGEGCSATEFIRCVQIGLLCVQESAVERPNMSQVLSMLTHGMLSLPAPKEPPVCTTESADNDVSQKNSKPSCSENNLTISELEGR